jgi:hypothetical protein
MRHPVNWDGVTSSAPKDGALLLEQRTPIDPAR